MQICFVKFHKICSSDFETEYFFIKVAILQLELLLEKGSIADVSQQFHNSFLNGPSKISGTPEILLDHS